MPDWKETIRGQLADARIEPTREAEIIEELAQHLDDRYVALLSEGASEEEAYGTVLDELGDNKLLASELRVVSASQQPFIADDTRRCFFHVLWQVVRYGFGTFRRQRVFTSVAVLTLALGMGANTAIFSVVYGVLLKPLTYLHAERILMLWTDNPA